MKSFRLHIESKSELVQFAIGAFIGIGVFLMLHHFDISGTGYRVFTLLLAAVIVGYLWRGRLCRTLRQRYPRARWIPLLAVGFTIAGFGVIARFVLPQGDEGWFTLAFILPAGACIAAFVIINRRDPDVIK
jgi:hypothetical protein